MKMTPKARAVLRERRRENRQWAIHSRHVREVAWFGSEGDRCYGCQDVPLLPWEQQDEDQQSYMLVMRERQWTTVMLDYVRYIASLRHEMRMAE